MTPSDIVLFVVVAVMGINHLTLRLPGWNTRLWLFWLTQLCNLGIACYLIWYGIPDFQGELSIVNYMIALLFIYHILVNNRRLTNAQKVKDDRPRLSTMPKVDDDADDGDQN